MAYRRISRLSLAIGVGVSAMALSCPAIAQDQPSPQAPKQPQKPVDSNSDDIVVTAQKRVQNVQDVPISIKAVSGADLIKSGINSADGVQHLAPGLTIATVGSGFVSYIYMRGGGTNQVDPGSDPSVAIFVDEVYVPGAAGLQFDLFDIDRVEVLKGPQGTLFGRNAAAGAISITTKRPSDTLGANLDIDAGNYGYVKVRGGVTGPLDKDGHLLFRVSGMYRTRDGVTDNLVPGGKNPGNIDTYGGRGQLEWQAGDVSLLLSLEGVVARNGMNGQFISTTDTSQNLTPAAAASLPGGESFYKHYYNVDGYEKQDLWDTTARFEWNTPIGKLTAISGYRSSLYRRVQDQDSTIADGIVLRTREQDRSFSQEIRLAGKDGGRFHWLAGLYYYFGKIDTLFDPLTGPAFPTVPLQSRRITDSGVIRTRSYAAYGQASYDITPALSLTVGARYSIDRKDDQRSLSITPSVQISIPVPPFSLNPFPDYSVDPSGKWHSFDPMVSLNYKITPDILAYASFRKGFKSGGFQVVPALTAAIANLPYKPEEVRSYEIGFKSTWFDRRFTFNAAIFRADITEQQIARAISPLVAAVDNAGATRTDGVDLQMIARPTSRIRLGADMTIQHARFRKYLSGTQNFAGNPQLRSPDFMGSYSAEYTLPLKGGASITARGEYNYRSRESFDPANPAIPGLFQPAYGLANARLTYAPKGAKWDIAIWGQNLGNVHYYRNVIVAAPTGIATPGDPLTFGVSLHIGL